eukprot:scaffold200780_cov39-Prasinocladus_malaysianus.AAC.1
MPSPPPGYPSVPSVPAQAYAGVPSTGFAYPPPASPSDGARSGFGQPTTDYGYANPYVQNGQILPTAAYI